MISPSDHGVEARPRFFMLAANLIEIPCVKEDCIIKEMFVMPASLLPKNLFAEPIAIHAIC